MKQSVAYSGLNINASDYTCQDGDLSECINMVNDGAGMKPIVPPSLLVDEDIELLYIHKVKTNAHWIYRSGSTLFYRKNNTGENINIIEEDYVADIHKIDSLGNILLLLITDSPNVFVFYLKNEYKVLGSKAPMINPVIKWNPAGRISSDALDLSFNTSTVWKEQNEIVSAAFTLLKKEKQSIGQSVAPYWIRLAYKMYDGSYVWHSNPILIPGKKVGFDIAGMKIFLETVEAEIQVKLEGITFDGIITDLSVFASEQCYQNLFKDDNEGRWPVFTEGYADEVLEASRILYHIKDFPIDGPTLNISYNPIKDITDLATKDADILKDEYLSHHLCMASNSFAYNSRMNLIGVKHLFSNPSVPVYVINQKSYLPAYDKTMYGGTFKVLIEDGGNYHEVQSSCEMGVLAPFYYYPDTRAIGAKYHPYSDSIKLKAHPFLNGAYALTQSFTNSDTPFNVSGMSYWSYWLPIYNNATWFDKTGDGSYKEDNKVFLSDLNNIFSFPASLRYTIGSSDVVGISTTAKALSQGQFGQFPLYAFTKDGIWAMEISSSGTYNSKQIISRDVCIDGKSITQLDNAIAFISDKGLMVISGSEITTVSDAMKGKLFVANSLPEIHKEGYPTTTAPISFVDYIKDCFMAYDYANSRIIIINSNYSYQYVYSLNTQTFSVMDVGKTFTSTVNSFPDIYLNGNGVYSVKTIPDENDYTENIKGFMLSKPIKFGDSSVYKSLLRLYTRGVLTTGRFSVTIYASDDNITYHLMKSTRGKAWKYYRIATYSDTLPIETIIGFDAEIEPRRNNRLR